MPSIPKDWVEQIVSKVNGSDFDRDEVPKHFEVSIVNEGKEIAHWDLTEELKQNGIAQFNYKNSTLNTYINFLFMHEDLKEKLTDDEKF